MSRPQAIVSVVVSSVVVAAAPARTYGERDHDGQREGPAREEHRPVHARLGGEQHQDDRDDRDGADGHADREGQDRRDCFVHGFSHPR